MAATQLSEDLEVYSDPTELEALGDFVCMGCLCPSPWVACGLARGRGGSGSGGASGVHFTERLAVCMGHFACLLMRHGGLQRPNLA
jgi:hypothetical protein